MKQLDKPTGVKFNNDSINSLFWKIREMQGLSNYLIISKTNKLDRGICFSYLNEFLILARIRFFKSGFQKDEVTVKKLEFIEDQMDSMELAIIALRRDIAQKNTEIKYLQNELKNKQK